MTYTYPTKDTSSASMAMLSRIMIRPHFLHPSDWAAHVPFGLWLVETLRPSVAVDVAARDGVCFATLCQAIDQAGIDGLAFAVMPVAYARLRPELAARYENFATVIEETPAAAAERFAPASIDLLSLHIRPGSDFAAEIARWRPLLSDRAVVIVQGGLQSPEVATTLREMGAPFFEFVHGAGLAVVGMGTALDPRLARFMAIDGEHGEQRIKRELFGRLGRASVEAAELRELKAQMAGTAAVAPPGLAPVVAPEVPDGETRARADAHDELVELLRERTGDVAALSQALIETQADLAEAHADLTRMRGEIDAAGVAVAAEPEQAEKAAALPDKSES